MRGLLLIIIVLSIALPSSVFSQTHIYTLYRNSVLDPSMRIHIATFDASDGIEYNSGNCWLTARLFNDQDGIKTTFWCEEGRFKGSSN
ncbi:hypothetical protein [Pseudovibrio sp. Alg231-02]|uniref:hypothetical protein n=1 Tax=Pseudovibrio sp. Alg231-02 TaxID=1922223 RepID=UPI00131EF283|nr:hypothetical protein [Pseudovibrio sp. Alg231-02]